jgi:hypothetical protein
MVRETPQLREVMRNTDADPPLVTVTGVVALEAPEAAAAVPTGFIWYEGPPKRWWQFWK